MFYIVEFLATEVKDAETAIVPESWFEETGNCYWPPLKDPEAAVRNSVPKKDTWGLYPARIIKAFRKLTLHTYSSITY